MVLGKRFIFPFCLHFACTATETAAPPTRPHLSPPTQLPSPNSSGTGANVLERPELSRSTVKRIIWWEKYQGSNQENLGKEIKTDIRSQNYNIHFKLVLAEIYIYPRQSNYIIALRRNDYARLNTCRTLCGKSPVFHDLLQAVPLPQFTSSAVSFGPGGFALDHHTGHQSDAELLPRHCWWHRQRRRV